MPERDQFFRSFFANSIFSCSVVSSLCFLGLGSSDSIQESSVGVTFLFFFLALLWEVFISEIGTGLWAVVGLWFQ